MATVIGDIPYAVQNTGPGGLAGAGLIDHAPLVQPPTAYTLIQAANTTVCNNCRARRPASAGKFRPGHLRAG